MTAVMVDNPRPRQCPTCGSSTTLASYYRDGGSTLYCTACKPVRCWANPDWERDEATGRMRRKPKPPRPFDLTLADVAAETARRFRESRKALSERRNVKIESLSPFTRDAIARTHGPVDDRDARQPTWNGRMLFIARLTEEAHVLHEVAHWIVAEKKERLAANYGLGTDPDGGPITGPWGPFTYTEHKEVEATLVTQHLLRLAGLPYGYGADTRVLPWFEGSDIDR